MSRINKISDLDTQFDNLFLDISNYYFAELPELFDHFSVYSTDESVPVANLSERSGSQILGENVITELNGLIEHLKTNNTIKDMWFVMYPPNQGVPQFNCDTPNFRYIVPLNGDVNFLTYATTNNHDIMVQLSSDFSNKVDVATFNTSFLEVEGNEISSLEPKSIYSVGDSGNMFFNASEDKLAFMLIYELVPTE